MQIEKKIDVQSIIGVVTDDVLQNLDHFISISPDNQTVPKSRNYIADKIWAHMLGTAVHNSDAIYNPACTAAELIHAGIPKENVAFRCGKYTILLNDSQFTLKRTNDGKVKTRFSIPRMNIVSNTHAVQIDATELASLIFAFDAAINDIGLALTNIEQSLRQRMLEQDKENKARQILMETIRALITECVKPLGLQSSYSVDNGVVHLSLTQLKKAEMDIPLEELAERLKDSEALMAALIPETENEEEKDDDYDSISSLIKKNKIRINLMKI